MSFNDGEEDDSQCDSAESSETDFPASDFIDDLLASRDRENDRGIHAAARIGELECLELMLLSGCDPDSKDQDGCTALHMSAMRGDAAAVEALLRHGASVDKADCDGNTALHYAGAAGHVPVLRVLLQHGADVGALNTSTMTAALLAADAHHADAQQLLHDAAAPQRAVQVAAPASHVNGGFRNGGRQAGSRLHTAVVRGRVADVNRLLAAGVPVDCAAHDGVTPLQRAAFNGQVECARALVQQGADVHSKSATGFTALHWAVSSGQYACAELLLQCGAHADAITRAGDTALHLAVTLGREDVVRLLLLHGASPHMKTASGVDCIGLAKRSRAPQLSDILLDLKATVLSRPGSPTPPSPCSIDSPTHEHSPSTKLTRHSPSALTADREAQQGCTSGSGGGACSSSPHAAPHPRPVHPAASDAAPPALSQNDVPSESASGVTDVPQTVRQAAAENAILGEKQRELDTLQAALANERHVRASMEAQVASLGEQLDQLKSELAAALLHNRRVEEEMRCLRSNLFAEDIKGTVELVALQDTRAQLQHDNAQLQAVVQVVTQAKATAQAALERAEEESKLVRADNALLHSELHAARARIKALQAQLLAAAPVRVDSSALAEVAALREENAQLQAQVTCALADSKAASQEKVEAAARGLELQETNSRLERQLASLQSEFEQHRSFNQTLTQQLSELHEAKQHLDADVHSLNAAIHTAEKRRVLAESAMVRFQEALKEERTKVRRELDIYERRITELRKIFMSLESRFTATTKTKTKPAELLQEMLTAVRQYQELLQANSEIKNSQIARLEKQFEDLLAVSSGGAMAPPSRLGAIAEHTP